MKLKRHLFIIFFVGLLLSLYQGLGEEYIIIIFLILFFLIKRNFFKVHMKIKKDISVFLIYYLIITVLGVVLGNIEFKSILLFFITYMILPFIVEQIVHLSGNSKIIILLDFRNFIVFSSIIGLVESLIKYNPLYKIINISANQWIINMNNTFKIYQPSSLYLHYTYYASILLIGITILMIFSYKSKVLNGIAFILMSEQIFVTQSRICWIAYVILIIAYIVLSGKISLRKISVSFIKILGSLLCLFIIVFLLNPFIVENIFITISKRFSSIFMYGFADGSLGQRVGTLLNWPEYFEENIFIGILGAGFLSIENVFLEKFSYFKGYNTADCQYVTFLIEGGIVGFILFLTCIRGYIKKAKKINKGTKIGLFFQLIILNYAIECVTYDIITYFIIVPLFLTMKLNEHINAEIEII